MNKRHMSLIALSAAIAIIILLLCAWFLNVTQDYPCIDINSGWRVTVGSQEYENVDLSEIYTLFKSYQKVGDTLIMSRELPYIGKVPLPAILFRSRYSAFECYLDNDLIYEFGTEKFERDDFVGVKYNFITLPYDYRYRILTFKLTACEKDAFTFFDPIYLGNQPDLLTYLISEHQFIILVGTFLLVFGLYFLTISLMFVTYMPELKIQIFGALLCIDISLYLMCYYNVLSLFMNTNIETEIEYFTLYMIVPHCYVMLHYIQNIRRKALVMTLFIVSIVTPLLQCVLYFKFAIHFRRTLALFDMNAMIMYGFIIYYIVKKLRKKKNFISENMQLIGIFALSTSGFIHFIGYTLKSNHIISIETLTFPMIGLGAIFFAMTQLTYYLLYVTKTFAQRKEYASLSHLAYADGLTNLPNRAKADKTLMDLNSEDTDYCIISIDLNGLKPVNDKFGHPTGDKYILDFSKVLTNTFEQYGLCARIGGDEFLVIIKDATSLDISGLINRMNSALNVMNALYSTYSRSVSTGYAFSHECPGKDSHEVYLMADQRMYESKKLMHEQMGIGAKL
ncbi:MAG: GGDEF domain-containing protein [Butyrivibrio sp.]|nr:GGDEF domain-containing protein [Butyrivibrio sp.]